ncbi:MAG TPA: L,D-transpeptidase family protein [Croceibacterium sp.]|nr:L,D-transpeptidase family protein [Croceibacterium sp.]
MKYLAQSLALLGALAFTLPAPAQASDETPQAIAQASDAAQDAHEQMFDVFGKDTLRNGQFMWKDGADTVTRVIVSLSDQMAYAYDGDELVGVSTISTARQGYITPAGIFTILGKDRDYRSKKFDNAPMPYAQRIDDYGIAMHGGEPLPGYPASHGCIRLPTKFAAKLFAATQVGTEVYIGGYPPYFDPTQVASND